MSDLVQMNHIDVRYGWRMVLKDISVSVRGGEVLLLTGPNAAGKTTLLRTLAGSVKPEKGNIYFKDTKSNRKTVGWVDHQSFLYDELTVNENLQFWAKLADVDQPEKHIGELLERFGLTVFGRERVEVLSFGMKKRVMICRAILGSPKLLLLDEAFNGLDQVGTQYLIDLIVDYRKSTSAVILTSHQVGPMLPIATDIAVLDKGRLILCKPISELDSNALCDNYLAYARSLAEASISS